MLIREPELASTPRTKGCRDKGGIDSTQELLHTAGTYNGKAMLRQKRAVEEEGIHDVDTDDVFRTKGYWVEVLAGFRKDMTKLHYEVTLCI